MISRFHGGLLRVLFASAAIATLVTACGPASPGPSSPATTETGAPSAAPPGDPASPVSAPRDAAPGATAEPAANAAPPKPGVPAESSSPPGVSPLTEAEAKEFSTQCRKFSDAVVAAAKKERGKKTSSEIVEAMLANPPKIQGVDVPRCTVLMRRDMVAFAANKREGEAKLSLKRILVGLMTALERTPPVFCASAPPVPASLEALKDKQYESTMAEWKAEGWTCARFDLAGSPQFFQFELRADPKAKSFELIARGYPVQGAAPTELYIAGKVERGAIDPSMPVMRR